MFLTRKCETMSEPQTPPTEPQKDEIKIGSQVCYRLTDSDVIDIQNLRDHLRDPNGSRIYFGNPVEVGQVYPAVVVRIWPKEFGDNPGFNIRVLLDGNDTFWKTSVSAGDEPGQIKPI